MKELTIELLAPYLPYGLKMTANGFVGVLEQIHTDGKMRISCSNWYEEIKDNKYLPVLRPLSDLTKEIEVNGERFVPIEELYKTRPFDGSFLEMANHLQSMDIEEMPYWIIQRFCKWHLDYQGLIPRSLAISIHEIKLEK